MTYTHLLFDFDHMLFDTDESEALAFANALRLHGVRQPEPLLPQYQLINQALWRQVEKGTISPNDVKAQRFEALATDTGLTYDAAAVAETYTSGLEAFGDLYEGALALVSNLADSHKLSMVTNGLGPVQRGRLDRIGLGNVFEPLVISGEVGVSKPGADIFEIVFEAFPEVGKHQYLMIGDSLTSDIQGGMNAGIATCWFNRHGGSPGDHAPNHEVGT